MVIISEDIDRQVIDAYARGYSESQIARMFNLRVSAVRRIRSEYSVTYRKKQDALSIGERIHEDVFNTYFKQQQNGCRVDTTKLADIDLCAVHRASPSTHDSFRRDFKLNGTVTGRTPSRAPEGLHNNPRGYKQHLPNLDYAGLEAHVLSGFFTTDGQPTPAFWGYVNQWCKKSGHALLDILHDQEIFAPEQLERALDIYQQVDAMDSVQLATLLRVVAQKVYETNVKDPSCPGTDVPDCE